MIKLSEIMYLLTMDGTAIKSLTTNEDTEVESVLGGHTVLSTKVKYDPKIKTEMQILWRNKRFIITDIELTRENGRLYTRIEADAAYMRLSDLKTEVNRANSSVKDLTTALLEGTRWSVGKIPNNVGGRHSMALDDNKTSVLSGLRMLERLTDGNLKLDFDTINYTVNFVRVEDTDVDVLFAYGRNTESVSKTESAPIATRIRPVGNNDMTIETVTEDGVDYVENYDYYLQQGYTLEEARQYFTKTYEFVDERFHLAGNLMREAERRLETLAFPQISYATTIAVIDQDVEVGMRGYVQDDELGIKVKAEIVRIVERKDLSSSEVELNYLIPGIGSLQEDRPNEARSVKTAMVRLTSDYIGMEGVSGQVLQISITNVSATNLQAGFNLNVESKPGVVLDGFIDIDGAKSGHTIRQSLMDYNSIGFPFIITDIMEGSHTIRLVLSSTGGDFKIPRGGAELFISSDNLASGHTPSIPQIDWVEEVELREPIYVEDKLDINIEPPLQLNDGQGIVENVEMIEPMTVIDNLDIELTGPDIPYIPQIPTLYIYDIFDVNERLMDTIYTEKFDFEIEGLTTHLTFDQETMTISGYFDMIDWEAEGYKNISIGLTLRATRKEIGHVQTRRFNMVLVAPKA